MQLIESINKFPSKLHEKILDILFQHKNEILRKLSDIRGLYFMDHVAITLADPNNEIIVFSITPSVEYNLIIQGLWKFDLSFYPHNYSDGEMIFWDKMYSNTHHNEIKYFKESLHNFALGFNLIRKIGNFSLAYSFATRRSNLEEYYKNLSSELLLLGDYGYKLIRNVYSKYSIAYPPPEIVVNKDPTKTRRHLKLVTNR